MAEVVPAARRSPSSLTLRVASGFVLIPVLLGVAYVGGLPYGVVIVGACGLAAWELRGMLRSGGYVPLDPVLLGVAVLLPLDAFLRRGAQPESLVAPDGIILVTLAVIGGLVTVVLRGDANHGLVDWATSLALGLYLGGLMQFYAPLREHVGRDHPSGPFWVMALLIGSWFCDSSAYFFGRAYGKTRLAPRISPSKSVEGAIAGVVGAAVAAVALGLAWDAWLTSGLGSPGEHGPALMAGFGVAMALATILGDLAESLVKRQTGVKDSGVLIPGHGGLLDRMDSLLFCGPVAFAYVLAFA